MQFFIADEVEEALTGHNLARMWKQAKKLLIHRWPTADQTPLKAVDAIIDEFHQADPNAQVFRYDADKGGKRHAYATLPDQATYGQEG